MKNITPTDLDLRRDTKNRTKARKEAERQTDWDTMKDRAVIAVGLLALFVIIFELSGGADLLLSVVESM